VLVEVSLFAKSRLKVTFSAELGDDIAVAVAGENLEAFEDIGVAQLFEDIDLREEQLLQLFAFERLKLHDLDGDDFICVRGKVLVSSL
jgi:hypothetical protein